MIYKDLNINFADMNVKIKFKEETEIPYQIEDIDALKETVLSNKKNIQEIEVEGKFSPEIFGLVTFADNFYYNSPEENLEMTKSENLKELKYNDMKINFENCVSGIEEVFSKTFLSFEEREKLYNIKEIVPFIFEERYSVTEVRGTPRKLRINTEQHGMPVGFEFGDNVSTTKMGNSFYEFFTKSAFHKPEISFDAEDLYDSFYANAEKEKAEIIINFDMDFDRFIVGDTEFRLQDDELKRIKGNMPEYKFKKVINALFSQVQANTRADLGKLKNFFKEDAEYNNIVSKVKNVRI
jgi:hypothetical protein